MSTGIYSIPAITIKLLHKILEELDNFERKVVIAIKNYSFNVLKNPDPDTQNIYFDSGTSNVGLPITNIFNGEGLVWGARKTNYSFKGSVGVFVYYIKDQNKSLAFMWSVPFFYYIYSNWWSIRVYEGHVEANMELFDMMYQDNPHPGDSNTYSGKLWGGWRYEGSMGDSGTPIIQVKFHNEEDMSEVSPPLILL